MKTWNWNPGVSVGELTFGTDLNIDMLDFDVELLPPSCDGADWKTYRIGDDLGRFSVASGKLVSVECISSLQLDNHELIGLSVDEINRLLPNAAMRCEVYEDGDERWECEALGLTLWVEGGVVTSATVYSPSSEDE